jgi:hypothetical protein
MTTTLKIELAPGARITPLRVTCKGGEIVALRGETGRTQDEEQIPLFGLDNGIVNLSWFIWSHYFSLLLDVEGDSPELSLESPDGKASIAVAEVSRIPVEVDVSRSVLWVSLPPKPSGLTSTITPTAAVAGSRQVFDLTFTVGPAGIAAGGGIMLLTPVTAWSEPYGAVDVLSLETKGNARLQLNLSPDAYSTRGPRMAVTVTGAALEEGDVIHLRYRERDRGIMVQTYVAPCVFLRALADESGHGNFAPLPLSRTPRVEIVPGPAPQLRFVCPTVVQAGKPFDARLVVLDDCCNPVGSQYAGACEISSESIILAKREFQASDAGSLRIAHLRIDKPGLHILRASADGLADTYQPVLLTDEIPSEQVYWGAIHGHSSVSDGEDTPDAYYTYGREVGLVDVCALTDHAWEIALHQRNAAMGRFAGIVKAAQRHHEDERFVTIPAYEWMGPDGHVNIYHLDDDPDAPVYVDAVLDGIECLSLDQLLERYRGQNVVVLPHASHGMRWNHFDPGLEPVVEMYSMWGNSEFECVNPEGANAGLQRGYRFGFIGGSDGHHGCPGQTGRLSRYKMLNCREGLAAFRAPRLTRSAIFDAIRSRSTYATTGERIYLEFSINGVPMGGVVRLQPGSEVTFRARVAGTAPLASIECVRNGKVVHATQCSDFIETAAWGAVLPDKRSNADYFYLRVTQQDGEMAWSSPIWVE